MKETALWCSRSRINCRPARQGVALAIVGLALTACPPERDPDVVVDTKVDGTVLGVSFSKPSAAHQVLGEGAGRSTAVRIASRQDTCEAIVDPVDEVLPSLFFVIGGVQPQNYNVVSLEQGAQGSGQAVATVTLLTRWVEDAGVAGDVGVSDSGQPDAFGGVATVSRSASSGVVVLQRLDETGDMLATGTFNVTFPDGGGSFSGTFYAPACAAIQ